MAKQDGYVRYTIRVPAELYDQVQSAAEQANRSINAEIVERLSVSFTELRDAELLLLRLEQDLERSKYELENARHTAITMKVMRHTINVLVDCAGDRLTPEAELFLSLLNTGQEELDSRPSLEELVEAADRFDRLEDHKMKSEERTKRMQQLFKEIYASEARRDGD